MIKEDCYIYWKEINGIKAIVMLCLDCAKNSNDKGVSWPAIWGYGESSIKCCNCERLIYSGREKQKG